ncbi:MAG: polysaccharide deacetylase family protein [Armatimonadetes bacterium]|nr:polysaccharide deacetylase family protein [Armatimonadota bacterium]
MICLTGDVHHMSLCTKESKYLPSGMTEVQVAQRYVQLLEEHGAKATLYVTGMCYVTERRDLQPVVRSPQVEVGGHFFWARQPRRCFDWYGRRTGNWNGPRWFQAWDIRRNIAVCRRMTGIAPVSWRAHSYKVDRNTYPLLARYGVRCVLDAIEKDTLRPQLIEAGLVSHPMNVIPDHDHLYHAHRTPEFVAEANRRGYGADDFGAVSYTIEEWGDLVAEQAEAIDAAGGVATVLAHPICMFIADEMKTFAGLLERWRGKRLVWAKELAETTGGTP